jgi:hypothetical protein
VPTFNIAGSWCAQHTLPYTYRKILSKSINKYADIMKKANNREMADEQSVNAALRSLVGIAKTELHHAK